MNNIDLLFFVCVGNVFAAIPKSKIFVAARSHAVMCEQARIQGYDSCDLLTMEQLLAMLDPKKGRSQVETVMMIFQNRPEKQSAIICYGPHSSEQQTAST